MVKDHQTVVVYIGIVIFSFLFNRSIELFVSCFNFPILFECCLYISVLQTTQSQGSSKYNSELWSSRASKHCSNLFHPVVHSTCQHMTHSVVIADSTHVHHIAQIRTYHVVVVIFDYPCTVKSAHTISCCYFLLPM